jgi:hypothetical protein
MKGTEYRVTLHAIRDRRVRSAVLVVVADTPEAASRYAQQWVCAGVLSHMEVAEVEEVSRPLGGSYADRLRRRLRQVEAELAEAVARDA